MFLGYFTHSFEKMLTPCFVMINILEYTRGNRCTYTNCIKVELQFTASKKKHIKCGYDVLKAICLPS